MPTTDQIRTRLVDKLKELFQLDQPELDFGFYRIMHLKSAEITQFLEEDLLAEIEATFAESAKDKAKSDLEKARDELVNALGDDALDEDGSVKADYTKLPAAKKYLLLREDETSYLASLSEEAQIYDHLYRFFERYYEGGDFLSRRYHTRETAGQAAPYAIPYNGEEVMLHWANKDQYYIKTSEHFSNFTFDLVEGTRKNQAALPKDSANDKAKADPDLFDGAAEDPLEDAPEKLPVHFRIKDATEGEHGNVKAADADKRAFFLHADEPVAFDADGHLVVYFEYRPARESDAPDEERLEALKQYHLKKDGTPSSGAIDKGNQSSLDMADTVLAALGDSDHGNAALYRRLLANPAPTDKINQRPLLAKYLRQYTARNSMDYFIHKDLGTFLRRELDFYIKNEIVRLDDLTSDHVTVPAVEDYLEKIKVLRRIARKIITFLAQLEDFQKRLWLKKKFITETQYCFTLDRVFALEKGKELISQLLDEVDAQILRYDGELRSQKEEWIKLYAIDELGDYPADGKLTATFLKAHDKLMLDTVFFSAGFKDLLLSQVDDLDASLDGVLIHSENFQALNLLQDRYREQVKCVYIDPPYNTDASEIMYKNGYKNSTWASMAAGSADNAKKLLETVGILCLTIDDFEYHRAKALFDQIFGNDNYLGTISIKNNPSGRATGVGFSIAHEYAIFYGSSDVSGIGRLPHSESQLARYSEKDENGRFEWVNFRKHGGANANRRARRKLYYPIFSSITSGIRFPEMEWDESKKEWLLIEQPKADEEIVYPIDQNGDEKTWKWGVETAKQNPSEFKSKLDQEGKVGVYKTARINTSGTLPRTLWDDSKYSATDKGTNLLKKIFGASDQFSFPKSIHAVEDCLRVAGNLKNSVALDYFAGSGTTGHAVINLNREDEGHRNYLLVEMGDHFDTVLKPRLQKVVYSADWKDGKPVTEKNKASGIANGKDGVSHAFKYFRLESYEDALNNLAFDTELAGIEDGADFPELKEDYTLRYLLEHQTRGSASLLNIDRFADPTSYHMALKNPHSDATEERPIDLIESFNYLLGLRVETVEAPRTFSAKFKRPEDPELPEELKTKLVLDGRLKQDAKGPYWLRAITGWVPRDPSITDEETRSEKAANKEHVLIIWRKLTGDLEKDNAVLDAWFAKLFGSATREREYAQFDTIYINGSNNLPNLKTAADRWRVELIEETFFKRMWS